MADELLVSLVRFEDPSGVPPLDDKAGLDALVVMPTGAYPTRENGPAGYAAVFSPPLKNALVAQDLTIGATSLQRDLTVQTILRWDIVAQNTAGTPGTIIARGYGDATAEYMPFAVELFIVDFATLQGGIRFLWNTASGTLKTELGGGFYVPAFGYFMLTATRHWTSLTSATIRYYINDQLIAGAVTADGDIASSSTGHTTIGGRRIAGTYGNFFAGAIDELALFNYEMTLEEIRATWLRISVHQPDGTRIMSDLLPIGLPISTDPTSRAQRDIQSMGMGLGFAAGLIENFRENMMPDRAYGPVLKEWEFVTQEPALPGDSIDTRRARVIGHMQRRQGVSIPGVERAIDSLLGVTAGQLTYYAFNPTIQDPFASGPDPLLWFMPSTGFVDTIGSEMRVQLNSGLSRRWDEAGYGLQNQICALLPVNTRAISSAYQIRRSNVSILACLDDHTSGATAANVDRGVCLVSATTGSMLFVGIVTLSGVNRLCYQRYKLGVAVDATPQVIAAWGGNPVTAIRITTPPGNFTIGNGEMQVAIHFFEGGGIPTTEAGWTLATPTNFGVWSNMDYMGVYARTIGGVAAGATADLRITNASLWRDNYSDRAYYWYAYRNPALGGSPDFAGANRVIAKMRHAYTIAGAIASLTCNADDPNSLADVTPCDVAW